MTTKDKNLLATQQNGALVETAASQAFLTYTSDRDTFLGTPFAHNRALARAGTPFTILQAGERYAKPVDENKDELIPCFVYLILLDGEYSWVNDNTGEKVDYVLGDRQLVSFAKNAIRETDYQRISEILLTHGQLPHVALQEYPSADPKRSNSHGFVHVSAWKTLAMIVAERKVVKG